MKKLEDEFREVVKAANEKIAVRLAVAKAALQEAADISEQFGVPFYTNMSLGGGRGYIPAAFTKKTRPELAKNLRDRDEAGEEDVPDIDNLLEEIGLYVDQYDGWGWQSSAIC